MSARWYLLRKEPVPESRNKTYDQQRSLLVNDEELPFACEMTFMVILYWLTRHERLLPDVLVRTQDKDSAGARVYFGSFRFDSDEFSVGDSWDGRRSINLGLSSSVVPKP